MIQIGDVSNVIPAAEVIFLAGIPDISGENTIFFYDRYTQEIWFRQHESPTLSLRNDTYTNINIMQGTMIVNYDAETILNGANYLMIKNRNKWYYCYLTGAVQNSVNSSTVSFEVDALQTYLFDYGIVQAYIEREHVTNDTVQNIYTGRSALKDQLECGDYIVDERVTNRLSGYSVIVWSAQNASGAQTSSTHYGLYNGVDGHRINRSSYGNDNAFTNAINSYINDLTEGGAGDSIVGICQVPNTFYGTNPYTLTIDTPETVDNYTPRNNILLSYPYTFCVAGSNTGASSELMFELADTYNVSCLCYYMLSPSPQAIMFPQNYRNLANDVDDAIKIDAYPQCAYAIDSYKAWLALNSNQINAQYANNLTNYNATMEIAGNNRALADQNMFLNSIGSIGGVIGGLASGNVIGAIGSGVSGITGAIGSQNEANNSYTNAKIQADASSSMAVRSLNAKMTDAEKMPMTPRGGSGGNAPFQYMFFTGTGRVNAGMGDFFLERRSIKYDQAVRLDNYYDMYGYKVDRLGIPNEDHRLNYWYTKTASIMLSGVIPYQYMSQIEARYNAGIRWWRSEALFGNYSIDNRTLLEVEPMRLYEPVHFDPQGVKNNVKK